MKTLGICFGATTIQAVELSIKDKEQKVVSIYRVAHEGNTRKALIDLLNNLKNPIDKIAVTGRAFRTNVNLTDISEPEAVEYSLREIYGKSEFPDILISAGGETQIVYALNPDGGIRSVHSGNKCASGTGEFFLQQIRRMGLTIEEAVALAQKGDPHKIAGRCSVFCKSDCTHALNKGEPRENVAAGLCLMMADKICDLVKDMQCEKVALIGGGSLNTAMVSILKTRFSQFEIPLHAEAFEAFGAALWAVNHPCVKVPLHYEDLVKDKRDAFGKHAPLEQSMHLVDFKEIHRDTPNSGDECIVGLDVGSTTTKAVLMRSNDNAIISSIYLRTNGDPVQASRNCYEALYKQLDGKDVKISAVGVTGSGRQIAALHALTDNVINEIIAHATAATYFDPEVDTIFEIGGQDAKYTYLTGGVPSDYAMNEACSAGTGSFLEESARETLNVRTEEIGEAALQGKHPPNFTDQCAAFISSDIKLAGQEGVDKEDILAGLVYSICLNYMNRVKGSRPVGKKIFMQGGVCYNKAVPVAMASLMQTQIIVPPEPGLMGAFGVALETAKRINLGISQKSTFDLNTLINRPAIREGSFVCNGGKEKCDRKCEISRIRVDGTLYPFGGICNKYYNLRLHKEVDVKDLDFVALRQELVYEKYGILPRNIVGSQDKPARTVGIMRSFLTHSLYPLYSNFFDKLGFQIVVPDMIDPEGVSRTEAAFCLPAEIAHGAFFNLLKKNPDYLFLPHVTQIPVKNVSTYSKTCVLLQGESYYLQTTFRKEIEHSTAVILSPVLRMDKEYERASEAFISMALSLGCFESAAIDAFKIACSQQYAYEQECLEWGRKAIDIIDRNPETFGIVVFGRPYNAFATDANMGIPHKVASRGYIVIPFDMLDASHYQVDYKMFWGMGQKIMKAAQFVKEHKKLFGFYITNFSCGPDSFLLGFFRNLMGQKPSLTLELDQHTADAGIDTRIEAAVDIIRSYMRIESQLPKADTSFKPAQVVGEKEITVISSDGKKYPLIDPHVEVILPSMGRYGTEAVAAILRGIGINARALPVADKDSLLTGRKNTSCKECLPYIVTTGSFLNYIKTRNDPEKVTLFFMATGGGPCRLGQYCRALTQMIEKNKLNNVAVFTMTDENSYAGLGSRNLLKAWQGILCSDIFSDIRSMLTVTAKDPVSALDELEKIWKELIAHFEGKLSTRFTTVLSIAARRIAAIPLKSKPKDVPVVSLIGEIYVRRDEFSRKNIVDFLEGHGVMVKVAPIAEFLCYGNYVINQKLGEKEFTFKEQMRMKLTARIQEWWEWRIKSIFAESGLYKFEMIEVEKTIESAKHLMSVHLRGETILTIGLGLREILHDSCGIISIGPFGCMPARVSESMLKKEMTVDGKARLPGWERKAHDYDSIHSFPFLSIETDGSPFPQLIEANLEAFVVQARRLHRKMMELRKPDDNRRKNSLQVFLYDIVKGPAKVNVTSKSKSE